MSYKDQLQSQLALYEAKKKRLLKEVEGIDEVIEVTKKKLDETGVTKKVVGGHIDFDKKTITMQTENL